MERQTLQQQTPVYHVCQTCGGEGCEACSDLCILDGDIELDPYECRYCGWIGGHVDGCVFVDPDLDLSPINRVIGITDDVFSTEARLAIVSSLCERFPFRSVYSEWNRSYLEDCGL